MELKKSAIIPVLILMLFSWSVSSDTYSAIGVTDIKQSKTLTLRYTWMINNFKLSTEPDNSSFFLRSPDFWPPGNESFKWYIRLYLAKSSVRVHLVHISDNTIRVNYTFSIGPEKRSYVYTFVQLYSYDRWPSFMDRTTALNSCLPNGTLIVNCEIATLPEIVVSSGISVNQYTSTESQANNSKFTDELLTLLEDEKFSDVTIVIEDNEIRAHRNILALRSPVFASLLAENATAAKCNGNSSIVEIKDVKPKVFRKLLRYVYADKVDGIDGTIAKDLLVAAIKYDVKGLKVMCEEILRNSINIDNAVEILEMADQYYIPGLKSRAMKFVGEHAVILKHSSPFKALGLSKPHLLNEVLDVIVPCKSSVQSAR